ncbi:MAG: Crp/Fnr family transcriptional regulator [Lysobacterales bacterium]|nr:MAG: Crp/Fnr family transcriptional regulator [Xanthomonadales bacterium]
MPVVNRLLAGLPARSRNDILYCCEEVELTYGEMLSESGEIVRYAYFPADGFISLMASAGKHTHDVSLIGNEGMFSPSSMLGSDVAPLRALVQGSGHALRLKTADLRRAADECPTLRDTLNRYLCVMIGELAQTAVCNGCHTVEARLARWLLMTHDRANSDRLRLTHSLLATMLGVRRSGVSVAAGALQARKAIRYRRGEIRIVDRSRLEAVSCECYGAVKSLYRRYLG